MKDSDYCFVPIEETITLFNGNSQVCIAKATFEKYFYLEMKKYFDITKIGNHIDTYLNAFHWLFANLSRIVGIQLYNDGEIRLNITPSQIAEQKCLLLKEDTVEDRTFDMKVYSLLFDCIYVDSKRTQ